MREIVTVRWLVQVLVIVALAVGYLSTGESSPDDALHFEPIKVVFAAQTIYPMLSIASGTVILQVRVNETGAIEKIDVIYGIPGLTGQAERSVRQWKFKPALLDGKPLASDIIASFSFSRPLPLGPTLRLAATPGEQALQFEPIRIVSATQALYPAAVATFGTVILRVTVGKSGTIDAVKTIHGIQWLTEQAGEAIRKWKFEPARLDDKPITSSMIASFTFASSPLNNSNR